MRSGGLCLMLLVGACYEAPSGHEPCAITCTDSCPGDLECSSGFCVEPGQVCRPTFTKVAAGTAFACAIDDVGALWCWGSNQHHQIDRGDRLQYPLATRVSPGPWTALDAGGGHVCGISNEKLYCWGRNDHTQVAPITGDVETPYPITVQDGPTRWSAVSTSHDSTCAIGEGRLYCWGNDSHGSLGLGAGKAYVDIAEPTKVATTLVDWTAIATGTYHSCGISASQGVLCWGFASYGAVGPNATMGDEGVPLVALAEPAVDVGVSEYSTCAATAAGALKCWGDNANAELGELNTMVAPSSSTPLLATMTTGWTQVDGDTTKLCGLAGDAVYCWGSEAFGGLGNGVWQESRKWVKVTTGATAVTVGWNYDLDVVTKLYSGYHELACALVGADVQCWGDNRYGQLGTGHATMALVPTELAGDHRFSKLALGDSHGCGLEGETLYCWGSTVYGAIAAISTGAASPRTPCMPGLDCDVGEPKAIAFLTSVDDLAVGASHTCALANDVISCWGRNSSGELGTAAPGPIRRQVAQPGGRPWTKLIPTGHFGQCATPGGGEVWCWGSAVQSHQTPTRELALDNITQITAGDRTVCVRDNTESLACVGEAVLGQFGTPATGTCGDSVCNADETQGSCGTDCGSGLLTALSTKYKSLAFSSWGRFACGVRADGSAACWGVNTRGQTGAVQSATTMLVDPTYEPHTLTGLGGCTAVAAGATHACALCSNRIWCWGDGQYGTLGIGNPPPDLVTTPQPIDLELPGDPWVQLEASYYATCARSMSGRVFCWGADGHAVVGNGGLSANLPVTVRATPQ